MIIKLSNDKEMEEKCEYAEKNTYSNLKGKLLCFFLIYYQRTVF